MTEGTVISPRGEEVRELVKAQLIVTPECNIYSWPEFRPIEKIRGYLRRELAWYLSGDRSAEPISKYASLWDRIKNEDGTLNSNYGYLVFHNRTPHPSLGPCTRTPFEWAASSLIADKETRQAVITYNTGGFNFQGNKDYICTQHQAFLIRDNVLRCFIALRSSDAIYGLPFNMPWWSLVHQQLFHTLRPHYPELTLGNIEVDIYSAHVYQRHYDVVNHMIASPNIERWKLKLHEAIPIGEHRGLQWHQDHLRRYVSIIQAEG